MKKIKINGLLKTTLTWPGMITIIIAFILLPCLVHSASIQYGATVFYPVPVWSEPFKLLSADFNNDGQYTNDVDLNGDGQVGVEDWEKGAVLMINSWGSSYANSGKVWVMYRMCADEDGMWTTVGGGFARRPPSRPPKSSLTFASTSVLETSPTTTRTALAGW